MKNKDNRHAHYSLEEAIQVMHEQKESGEKKIILTILYEIWDIKEAIETMDNEMRGYDP